MNQKLFDRRYEILNGALAYITDYLKIYKRIGCINEAKTFVNELWHQFYSGNIQLSYAVKEIFYYDNTIVKRDDIKMFD